MVKSVPALVAAVLAIWFINASLGTWAIMVGLGNLHHLSNAVPAYGFWQVFSVWVWFAAAISVAARNTSSSNN